MAHTQAWQGHPAQPAAPVVQPRPPELVQLALHWTSHSLTHSESHAVLQQYGSMPQTQVWQGQLLHVAPPAWHPAPPHVPQSPGQVSQVSLPLHEPSPHTGPQAAHWLAASLAQRLSQATLQQKVSPTVLQTHSSTVSTSQPGVPFAVQHAPVQDPHWSASPAQMLSHTLLQQNESMAHTQSLTAWFWHPMVGFAVQHEPVHENVPTQAPLEQVSLLVQGFPSLQGLELFVNTQLPLEVLHESLVHGLLSLHTFGAPG